MACILVRVRAFESLVQIGKRLEGTRGKLVGGLLPSGGLLTTNAIPIQLPFACECLAGCAIAFTGERADCRRG